MTIEKTLNGAELTVVVAGRLDTITAPELESSLWESNTRVSKLVLELVALAYVSSAGLRVILQAQKTMNKQGEMVIRNVNESINEVFEVTGFIDILTIE